MAHELAHLFLGHGDIEQKNKIQKFYFVTENREPLGFQQKNDPALAKFMIDWMARAKESQLYKMLGIMDASQRYELWAKYPNNGAANMLSLVTSETTNQYSIDKDSCRDLVEKMKGRTVKSRYMPFVTLSEMYLASLLDIHHNTCWRAVRDQEKAKAAKAVPAPTPAK